MEEMASTYRSDGLHLMFGLFVLRGRQQAQTGWGRMKPRARGVCDGRTQLP